MAEKESADKAPAPSAGTVDTRAWLRPFVRPLRPIFREVLLMSLFINLLALAVPAFTMQVYDRVIFHAGLSTLQGLAIGMVFVILFDHLLRQGRSRIMQKAALRIDVGVGRKLFDKVLAVPLSELESKPNAHWQALFRDVEMVRNTLSGPSALLVADLPFALIFIALIVFIAAPIVWVLAIILPLYVLLAWRSATVLNSFSADERKVGYGRDALVQETIAGRATVKALALDESIRPMWEERHADTIVQALDRGRRADQYVNLGAVITMMSQVALTAAGALAIIDQQMSIGSLIAANMLAGRVLGPFNQLVGSWRNYAQFKQAVSRLGELFRTQEERQEAGITMERPRGEITVQHVTFRYGEEDAAPIIDNLRFRIEPGNMVSIMGPNGSGKTTLIKMLQGLYQPSEGRVLLDEADITQFSRHQMAAWMGYVPQDTFLFTGSIRDNIAKGHPDATDDEIIAAARRCGLHDHVIDLPDGYGTDIGEAARRLPGGLRQRVAIARAFIGNPSILILDEPSSNLDREGEQELATMLRDHAEAGHTVIVVTHSTGMLMSSHQVLVMQKGRLVRAGRPEDVLTQMAAAPARPSPQPPAASQQAPAQAQQVAAPPAARPGGATPAQTASRTAPAQAQPSTTPRTPAAASAEGVQADDEGASRRAERQAAARGRTVGQRMAGQQGPQNVMGEPAVGQQAAPPRVAQALAEEEAANRAAAVAGEKKPARQRRARRQSKPAEQAESPPQNGPRSQA